MSQEYPVQLMGIDFSSNPSRKKPIAVAMMTAKAEDPQVLRLSELRKVLTLTDFEKLLTQTPEFVAAIDMPFGLSRQLVDGLGWPGAGRLDPEAWADLIRHYSGLSKSDIRATFKAWCDARPAGSKFAHRASDGPAGASPSMKWVNPPVAFMLYEGAQRLLNAGVHIPGMRAGDSKRTALEAYPGYFARQVLKRQSYKNDDVKKDAPDRQLARSELICAMEEGMLLDGLRLEMPQSLRAELLLDHKGDWIDAALCGLVAAWANARRHEHFGLPAQIDPVEGWIAGVL